LGVPDSRNPADWWAVFASLPIVALLAVPAIQRLEGAEPADLFRLGDDPEKWFWMLLSTFPLIVSAVLLILTGIAFRTMNWLKRHPQSTYPVGLRRLQYLFLVIGTCFVLWERQVIG
jgi:hypothetical protein